MSQFEDNNQRELRQKVVFITGAAQGIGRQVIIELIKYGLTNFSISDINFDKLKNTKNELLSIDKNLNILINKCNVVKESDVINCIDSTIKHFGRLDFAVNNAGILGKKTLVHKTTEVQWDQIMNVNAKGVFFCLKHEIKYFLDNLKKHKKKTYLNNESTFGNYLPSIVNVASVAGIRGMTAWVPYAASKFAVMGMTKTLSGEMGHKGIRINGVAPNITKTQLGDDIVNQIKSIKLFERVVPMRRFAKLEETAQTIAWLLVSPNYINGSTIAIDGGMSAL